MAEKGLEGKGRVHVGLWAARLLSTLFSLCPVPSVSPSALKLERWMQLLVWLLEAQPLTSSRSASLLPSKARFFIWVFVEGLA